MHQHPQPDSSPTPRDQGSHLYDAYLMLLRAALTHTLYQPPDLGVRAGPGWRGHVGQIFNSSLRRIGILPLRLRADARELQRQGKAWPVFAHTMVGTKRLENLQTLIEDVVQRGISGDLIETGAWRGGSSIFMRGVLKALNVTDRRVWVADSFQGLPEPTVAADGAMDLHLAPQLAISLEEVQANFRAYGLLDDQVRFIKGWFRDTLPRLQDVNWALLRLDGDLYESTMDALTNLYPQLSPGGYVIIDDYSIPSCRRAVEVYRRTNGINDELHPIDGDSVFWQRGDRSPRAA